MGLFGGGNSSSTTNSQSAGFSQVGGAAIQVLGTGNNIRVQSPAALKLASTVSSAALKSSQSIAEGALTQVQLAGSNAATTEKAALSAVASAAQGQTQNIMTTAIKWAALAAVAYFAMRAFGKG